MKTPKEDFLETIKDHKLTIQQDAGVHRCLLLKKPESSNRYFYITTWPGHLCISGDMGTYAFSRIDDMFNFFRDDKLEINLGYWAEKLQSISCFGSKDGSIFEFDVEGSVKGLIEYFKEQNDDGEYDELLKDIEEVDVGHMVNEQDFVRQMQGAGVDEPWEHSRKNPTHHIQWCMYAIVWAIQQFDNQ